ncbi:hypothetical protein ACFLY2_02170 [Patescibacteria group bacterium]
MILLSSIDFDFICHSSDISSLAIPNILFIYVHAEAVEKVVVQSEAI